MPGGSARGASARVPEGGSAGPSEKVPDGSDRGGAAPVFEGGSAGPSEKVPDGSDHSGAALIPERGSAGPSEKVPDGSDRGGAAPVSEGGSAGVLGKAPDGSAQGDSARASEDAPASIRKDKPADAEGAAPNPSDGAKETPTEPGDDSTETAPDAQDAAPDRQGVRPADVAREALRAARREAQWARTGAEAGAGAGAGEAGSAARASRTAPGHAEAWLATRPPRATPSAARTRAQQPNGVAAVRARAVRDLVADAFRMPQDEDSDAVLPGANDPADQASRDVRTPDRTDPEEPDSLTKHTPPATSRPPTSMASPSRDSDLRRTFPAFSPRPSDGTGFAETWWGNAWVTALEEGALDAKRLARGRSYAEKGHVDAITVTPGLVLAYVQGSRPRPYRVQVRLRTLDEADWERFLDTAADRPGHIAALLDKEMPKSLAESGVPLLPGPGDLDPLCSCPDSGHPCKHAAALCYQTARLLDADPFVLLLLRGRGERPLLDALSRRNAARAARAAQEQEPAPLSGVRATDALAPRRLPPLPPPLPMPPHPEQPPVYPAAPGGPDPFALDQLATDAAARAHALLSTGRDPVGELTLWQDAVRLAAARPGSGLTATTRSLYASLTKATGRSPGELARAVAAWRQGGIEGLAVLEEPWDPPAGRFDRARPLLLAADLPAFRPWHNHLTHPHGHVQLRLGRDGLWYAYESEPGHEDWWPRGTPDLDPVGALTGLGAPGEL
ncbi:SWIM zinc finger family protein [Streptomyces xylophagus]|uniref:SWIM zinc finger family protein n=1 Tax=Streptomyces xylophagus TaxID=285514 RepID=UPI002D21A3A5|nr:SWIM zinc finger family protein [Streptomyces xylophagus]